MKNIIRHTLLTFSLIALTGIQAKAQEPLATKTTPTEVSNYETFVTYNKKLIPANTTQSNISLDKTEIIFPSKATYQFKKLEDGEIYEEGFLSPNKDQAAVFSWVSYLFDIYNRSGEKIKSTLLLDLPFKESGTLTFSNTRIFLIPRSLYGCNGFEIRTSTGSFIRYLNICDMAGYAVSYDQKLFLVASMDKGTDGFFRVYDMDGNELWKHEIASAREARIELSNDNRFVAIKMPEYWVYPNKADPYHATRKQNKLYVFDIVKHILVSEEDYTP